MSLERIVAARVRRYALELDLGSGPIERLGWTLELTDEAGRVGLGDLAPWPGFGAGEEAALADLAERATRLVGAAPRPPEGPSPEASYCVGLALADLEAQARGLSLARLLTAAPAEQVECHGLVRDAESAAAAVNAGATVLKVKVRGAEDVARVAAIRETVGPAIRIRLDANGAWTLRRARTLLPRFEPYAPEWIEQPTRGLKTLARLANWTTIPLAADEDVRAEDLDALCEAVDVVVIKPMFLGGPREALAFARRARRRGLKVCVTSALESRVGRLGALHVAAALADGEVHGVALDRPGPVAVPPGVGLGLDERAVAPRAPRVRLAELPRRALDALRARLPRLLRASTPPRPVSS